MRIKELIEDIYTSKKNELERELKREKQGVRILTEEEVKEFYKEEKKNSLDDYIRSIF